MNNFVNEKLNDFGQLYGRYTVREPIAQQLLQIQHRYLVNLTFDPLTGEALPQRMSHWLSNDNQECEDTKLQDRFTHLIDHAIDAVNNILIMPRQTINRVHEMTPVYLAQRLDSRSLQWLSRKPGNNLREKLAANPHILAATRKMSFDTLENRLLKAFLIRVQGLLLDRQEANLKLTEQQEALVDLIQKVLREDDFAAIKPWQHMPPNNVLLQDKQYRKVWRSWRLLNLLEDDCECQQTNGIASGFNLFSELLKQLASKENCLLLDQAWDFKFDILSVKPVLGNTGEDNLVEVLALDLGNSDAKSCTKITPHAELLFSLKTTGNIEIKRRVGVEQTQNWQIEFLAVNGLINIKLNFKNYDLKNSWQKAMPESFSGLAKRLVNDLIQVDRRLKLKKDSKVQISSDFASVMFDGASYKFKTNEKVGWIGPNFLDASGLDCSQSLSLSDHECVVSTKELAQVNSNNSYNRQLSSFATLLATQIRVNKGMHYLVRDHHSEFETSDLRREINRNFGNANPLPTSIASVYALLEKKQFKRNDLIMVLSSDHAGIYATPVYYRWNEHIGETYLERHPSIKLSQQGEQQLLQRALVNAGLLDVIAKRFIELYSYSEIVLNKARLVLHDGEHWYRVPTGLKVENIDISDVLVKETYALQKREEKVYFLSVSTVIKKQHAIKLTQWLVSDPLLGSQRLLEHQYEEPHKVFWKDHLPQLMTRLPVQGIEKNFYFVDSRTSVKPERGVAINIPIASTLNLPPGKEEIPFTIYQGVGNYQQVFSLLLSLKQPLKTSCECTLTLTYTYGDEQPYKLRFSPIGEEKPFHHVDAQWGKKIDNSEPKVVAIPIFPEKLKFASLYDYPGKDKQTNIVEWIERNLEQLDDIYQLKLKGLNSKRFNFNHQDIKWLSGKDFGFYELHPQFKSIFVHKSKFKDLDVQKQIFSADVFAKEGRHSLENIGEQGEISEYELKKLSKRWRFPMLIFSDQSRCFNDAELPPDLARTGFQAIQQAQDLLLIKDINKTLEKELKIFLSYCHKLMPQAAVNDLLQASTDKKLLRQEDTRFKYALGDVSELWQQQLLENLLAPSDDTGGTRATTLEILSVAMWRDKAVIHRLTKEQVIQLTRRLNEYLLEEIKRLQRKDEFYKWNVFILRLELLLALLRTRESINPEISSLFALDSHLTKQVLTTVEKITDTQGEALEYQLTQQGVVARVKLNVNKPDGYHRTPDLLYALKLYLSGDDGADQITITELVNNA
ncbi:DUF2357 domain-containing protein [Acinetobacter sp. YH16058]|uniref:DUF2357 domain-containing protein n=1 Tax=Acinetobacter sp. YH16058 TaxID=2601196 RepID=UPI0015D2FC3D|nr:DUF2357 domain-containing protein [Acinetobacter sp. YH16058]